MSYEYSENILVQNSAGNVLEHKLGWDVVYAYNTEVLGEDGTLGRRSYKEIVLTRARELLTSTNDSVEEISRRLGFSSGAYFRKCFKKQFGASPREIRRHSEI